MKNKLYSNIAAALFAGLVSLPTSVPSTAQEIGQCLSPAQAGTAVTSNQVMKLAQILQLAGVPRNATVHNQQVCYVNGELAYILDILGANGTTQRMILRGRDGTPYS